MRRLEKLLPQLRKFGVTSYRETDPDGGSFEVTLGTPAEPNAAKKVVKADEKEDDDKTPQEKYPKDAAALALKLVGNR